ncbi:MAG: two component, sigma54 specific, transcriptional regulator, Fis family [Candidatus Angelobacter sp.]|jgi:two-component system response regulator AtoC|nr:two component, sigma54 specific, transcriptional regulator, Fis family [Candidatus Angelobacter sp.]
MIVDGDSAMSRYLSSHLAKRNFDLSIAASGEEALRIFRSLDPGLVLMDVSLPGMTGMETLSRLRHIKPDVSVIVISAQNNPELIFKASKLGADEYVAKPFDLKDLDLRITRVIEKQHVATDAPQLRDQVRGDTEFSMLFGTSPKMEDVKMTIEKVADTNATVLIRGESGTGKEMVARMVYAQSGRHDKAFVKVNCAAIPHELLESELFGYEQGAFTGANRQKLGKFDQANNGSIFLDEISEMHPALQAKLLHVLQDGEFARLGGKRDIAVDVRVLAATNKPLERAVAQGSFREDLFYRLNVVTIHIPPLRERREEISVFLDFFLNKYSHYYGKNPPPFSENAIARMMDYTWPGNIRELENLVKRYTIVGNEPQIIRELSTHKPIVTSTGFSDIAGQEDEIADFPTNAGRVQTKSPGAGADVLSVTPSLLEIGKQAAMKAEREAIERVLSQTKWNRRQAAKILKISYKALLNKLKLIEEQDQAKAEQRTA